MSKIKVAGVQMNIALANRQQNLDQMRLQLETAVRAGAQLIVFPECTTTGYCYQSLEEALPLCETLEDVSTQTVHQWCQALDAKVVFGFLERDGDEVFNSLALVGPSGILGRYRKIHLPHLGIDRFVTPGRQSLEVIETPELNIGMNICYDSSFPEAARILSLKGADLITLPTNWPPTSSLAADVIPNARALENHVYFMAVNRIGQERAFSFIGKSKICDPAGQTLAFAHHADEEIIYAEIDPTRARQKRLVSVPGEHEVHRFNDRRPDLYGPITEHGEPSE